MSNFGLAKLIGGDFSRVLATMRGTWGYVAPEWISGVAITTKADRIQLWNDIAGVAWQQAQCRRATFSWWRFGGLDEKWFFPPWAAREIIEGRVTGVLDERLGNIYKVAEAERAGLVAVWCIKDEEAMRPTMGMVVKCWKG